MRVNLLRVVLVTIVAAGLPGPHLAAAPVRPAQDPRPPKKPERPPQVRPAPARVEWAPQTTRYTGGPPSMPEW